MLSSRISEILQNSGGRKIVGSLAVGANLRDKAVVNGKQNNRTKKKYARAGLLNGAAGRRTDMKRLTYFDNGKWRVKIGDTEYRGHWAGAGGRRTFETGKHGAEKLLTASQPTRAVAEITEFEGIPIDRLRELAQADREGRCVVLPKDGMVYYIEEAGGEKWIGNKPIQQVILRCGFGMALLEFSLFDKGKYFSRAEAEEALRREQDGQIKP